MWKERTSQEELSPPKDGTGHRDTSFGKRVRPATVEPSAVGKRAPQTEKSQKQVSRQGKPAEPDKDGWTEPRHTRLAPEFKETPMVEVNNPFLPLEVTEAELMEPQELPEKRKSEGQSAMSKLKRKEKTQPALKAAGVIRVRIPLLWR